MVDSLQFMSELSKLQREIYIHSLILKDFKKDKNQIELKLKDIVKRNIDFKKLIKILDIKKFETSEPTHYYVITEKSLDKVMYLIENEWIYENGDRESEPEDVKYFVSLEDVITYLILNPDLIPRYLKGELEI